MKNVYLPLVVALLFVILGCTSIDMATYENDDLYAELETNNSKSVTLNIKNQTDSEINILPDQISYSVGDKTYVLAPEWETGVQPGTITPVPSGENASRFFVAPHAVTANGDKRKVAKWVPESLQTAVFSFGYRVGEADGVMVFPENQERVLAGKVNVGVSTGFPLFRTVAARRLKLYNLAMEQAKTLGDDIRLVNIRYDGRASFFAEKATFTADVVKNSQ